MQPAWEYPLTVSYEFGSHWMILDQCKGQHMTGMIGGFEELFKEGQCPIGYECIPQQSLMFTSEGDWYING